jgi:thiamine kinase-like enzyme
MTSFFEILIKTIFPIFLSGYIAVNMFLLNKLIIVDIGMTKTLVEEIESWPEEWHKYATKFRRVQDKMVELIQKATRRNGTGLKVLAHGDIWLNNVMFRRRSNSVRLVDFQLVNFTTPVIDLHYFICTTASLDVRMHEVDTLLQVSIFSNTDLKHVNIHADVSQ